MKAVKHISLMSLFVILLSFLLASCSSSTSLQKVSMREIFKIIEYKEEKVLIYIHGSGDTPSVWAEDKVNKFGGVALDWSLASANKLQAPKNGYEIGKDIGLLLNQKNENRDLLLIAHSAGAWVVQGIADSIENKDLVEIIFLDPFTASSIFTPLKGSRMLGKNAREVSTYYTSLDPIPFTNGKVNRGNRIKVDDSIVIDGKKRDAHWDVIDVYFNEYFKGY